MLIFALPLNPPPENPQFIPDAMSGFATISGVLSALTGYLITYIIGHRGDTPKAWLSRRITIVIVVIAFGLLLVLSGFSQLVFGNIEQAYNIALVGTLLLILVFLEVMSMVFLREFDQTIADLSDAL